MTYDQLLEKYPMCAKDISMAYDKSERTDCDFEVTIELLYEWDDFIDFMRLFDDGGLWTEPEHEFEARVHAIMSAISAGAERYPVFCIEPEEVAPHGVREGFHRVVASVVSPSHPAVS